MSQRLSTRGRTLQLVDLENLVAGSPRDATAGRIVAVARRFQQVVRIHPDDQVIVGHNPSPTWLFASTSAFPGAGVRVRGHADGGETAILDLIDATWIARRFEAVVIGSGDRAFVPLAAALRAFGVHVTAAAPRGAMSRDLANVADVVLVIAATQVPAAA